ncbi:MAG: hypothetical protein K2P81_16195 [Bacteriovoracaceae bacterium]|nr:hypothetical protein [Bacteriovoracaceae bacterium]
MKEEKNITALVPISEQVAKVDPSELNSVSQYFIADNIGLKLLHVNQSNDYEKILAESIEFNNDRTEIIITIKDAKFSDGSSITSTDVKNTFKRMMVKGSPHIPLKDFIKKEDHIQNLNTPFNSFEVISEKKLKIHLSRPTKEILYYFTLADSIILHSSQIKEENLTLSDWSITSGPYFLRQNNILEKNKISLVATNEMPDKVKLIPAPEVGDTNVLTTADMGYSFFLKKEIHEEISLPRNYKFSTDSFSTINFLAINTKSDKFKDIKTRQWLNSKIQKRFLKDLPGNPYYKKANQFFLVGSKFYRENFNCENFLSESDRVPDSLKDGLTIMTAVQGKKFAFDGLENELEAALGIKVTINFTDSVEQYQKRKVDRDYDAYFVPTSASYHVASESLNLLYKAKKRFADNPNGKINDLIDSYQKSEGDSVGIVSSIIEEMCKESEVIPLYYLSSPKFYNSSTVDISAMNPNESMTFWRIRVL